MSLPLVLILLSLGIALSQAASKSGAVTLRWLRLGDLIALSLLGIAAAALLFDPPGQAARGLGAVCGVLVLGTLTHLMLVQSGRRTPQRIAIAVTAAAAAVLIAVPYFAGSLDSMRVLNIALPAGEATHAANWPSWLLGPGIAIAAWLTGGSLMTMLLGHAYLTSGSEMTQQPFLRLVRLLLIGLIARLAVVTAGGLIPWWMARDTSQSTDTPLMPALMIAARFLVGIVVPIIMTWMALQCVRIRSNQSATGILYVSSTMMLVGEFLGLALASSHGLAF